MHLSWVKSHFLPRTAILFVRSGDPKPENPMHGEWWSGAKVEVYWQEKGVWEWLVWLPLLRGTGRAATWGTASTSAKARKAGALAMLKMLPDQSPSERAALLKEAGISVLRSEEAA